MNNITFTHVLPISAVPRTDLVTTQESKLCLVHLSVRPLTVVNTGYNFAKDVSNIYVAGYTASSNSCKKIRGEVEVSVLMPKNIRQ